MQKFQIKDKLAEEIEPAAMCMRIIIAHDVNQNTIQQMRIYTFITRHWP